MVPVIFVLLLLALSIQGAKKHNKVIVIDVTGNDIPNCLRSDISCQSLSYVLIHLQNNSYINITSDVVLIPRMVNLSYLNAITIRGHGNTIMMCDNTDGVSCNNCSNVVIEGITWDQYMVILRDRTFMEE